MTRLHRRPTPFTTIAVAIGAAALFITGCGTSDEPQDATEPASVSMSEAPSTSEDASIGEAESSSEPPPETTTQPPIPVVAEGAWCSPLGATAIFADGATAYCARLQATDGGLWSRSSDVVPNPALTQVPAGPAIGDRCIGAETGQRTVDANGTAIVCDEYRWSVDIGQTPGTWWGDGQRESAECRESHTEEECRGILNRN